MKNKKRIKTMAGAVAASVCGTLASILPASHAGVAVSDNEASNLKGGCVDFDQINCSKFGCPSCLVNAASDDVPDAYDLTNWSWCGSSSCIQGPTGVKFPCSSC